MTKVKVVIDALGNPTVEAEGFVGGACKSTTDSLIARFGGGGAVTEKPEMHLQPEQENETHLHLS